jgi:ribosomal protein L16 Arg81 hydroxylase
LPYAANNRIPPHVFRMLGIEHPFEHLNRNVRDPNIWIGPSGASTPLHKDSTDNAALQLFGSKRWTLYSIADHDLLRFEASSYGSYVHRNAEFAVSARNDDAAVNSTANASEPIPHDVVVDAGDLLYVPYGWGHSVENITVSVMLNVWFALDNYRPLVVCL